MTADAIPLWRAVFGNDRPVELEIGPGRGEVLLACADMAPAINFFAIERAAGRAERIMAKATSRGLGNVRVIAGEARCVVALLLPHASVAAYHVYFPDPWPKTRHRLRRLFLTDRFARELHRTLVPGGTVDVATDLPAVLETANARLAGAGLVRDPDAVHRPSRPMSSFERRYAAAGTYYGCWRR